ncbi:FAD-dependent oxidoreductase [Bdellovibrionota bacterium FG-2]
MKPQANPKSVTIIGAGPAGLAAAYELCKAGHVVSVFEASPYIGGLSRSFELWGQTVDMGPHRFFSSDKIVNDLWHEVIGADYSMVNRLTRIYYRDRFFYYPLQPMNAFFNLGPVKTFQCILSYLITKIGPSEPAKTFEDWVVSRFGRRLFEIFFQTYTEKVWGISCKEIDADWAAQRIKKLSLFEAIKAAFFKDKKQKHKTLVEQFAYPKGGTGTFYKKMADQITRLGGSVHLETPVKSVLTKNTPSGQQTCGIQLENGQEIFSDIVVSTMPITVMVQHLPGVPKAVTAAAEELYYRNTILAYIEVSGAQIFPDNWIYVHSPEVRHGRITNFRNWCPSLYAESQSTILCMEFWCFENDAIWSETAENLGQLAIKELNRISLMPEGSKALRTHILKVPRSYPVYQTGFMKPLETIQNYVDSIEGLYAIGRNGAFKYNNQDHSILMGLLVSREIITGDVQNLWHINTDSEYQEQATTDEAGLNPPRDV